MNNYIVDPMFFYWCNVANGLIVFCAFGLIVVSIAIVIFIANAAIDYDSIFEVPKFKRRLVLLFMIAVIFGLGMIFIPTKETLIEMEIARHATYDNLDVVIQKITEVAKEIVGK